MTIQHLPASSPINVIHELLQRDGCVVLDAALDGDTLQAINREMKHHLRDCSKAAMNSAAVKLVARVT